MKITIENLNTIFYAVMKVAGNFIRKLFISGIVSFFSERSVIRLILSTELSVSLILICKEA